MSQEILAVVFILLGAIEISSIALLHSYEKINASITFMTCIIFSSWCFIWLGLTIGANIDFAIINEKTTNAWGLFFIVTGLIIFMDIYYRYPNNTITKAKDS